MMLQVISGGFLLGLISSLHCIGMCGPIALSIPVHHLPAYKKNIAIIIYNTGRVVTYTSLGLLFGFFGKGIFLAGFQQLFSILLGIIILVVVLFHFIKKRAIHLSFGNKFQTAIQNLIGALLKSKSTTGYLLLGMANGLLPCGLVYIALAGAISYREILHSGLFMAMYGFGTMPAMIGFSIFGVFISMPLRNTIKKGMPFLLAIIGVIFIVRGLNLGIPYLSPMLSNIIRQVANCY